MHANSILHRDLKPSNIIITPDCSVKIGDFGSAICESEKALNGGLFKIEGFTTWYKAPELLFGDRAYSFAIDIWSFGCIAAEFFNGVPLFSGVNDFHQISKISSILGAPIPENWPDVVKLPDYGKLEFVKISRRHFKEVFYEFEPEENELLSITVKYGNRPSASKILDSSYFSEILDEKDENQIRKSIGLAVSFPRINEDFKKIFKVI